MIKTSLFADQEREAKLNKLGDALRVMEQHVDFAALAEEVDRAAPPEPRARWPSSISHRTDGAGLADPAAVQSEREQMEFQLLDRLSFQRFVGLRQQPDPGPDAMPIAWKPAKRRQKDTD